MVIVGIRIASPLFFKIIVDKLQEGASLKNSLPLIFLYLGFLLFSNIIDVVWYEMLNVAGGKFLNQIRNNLFIKIIKAPFEKTIGLGREKIKNILFSDVMQMFSSLTLFGVKLIANFFVLLIGIIVAFVINKMLGAAFFAFIVVGFSISFFSRKIIKHQSQKVNIELKSQNAVTNNFIDALELYKTHALENYITEKHSSHIKSFVKTILKADGVQVFFKNLLANVNSIFILLSIGLLLVLERGASVGDVLFLSFISQTILSVSIETEGYFSQLYSTLPAFENINSILEMPDEKYGEKTWNRIKSITFDNVSFAYECSEALLKDLNYEFLAGERIKVEGENGTGKSTFIKILSGLLKPTFGEIKINSENFDSYTSDFLKKKILYVSQDEVILNENILAYFHLLGINFSKDELYKKLNFWNFKTKEVENIADLSFTDNAKNLSGGMRKKILAIKLFEKVNEADIIIVDEICAGLDVESSQNFYQLRSDFFKNTSGKEKIYFEINHDKNDNEFFTRKVEFTSR
ncbi:ATP-binding cassette domain-containing protein [Treponema denticola]|uniref:ATP-binding cassette domain-containing protein n=1 Tax=Treponema denticola TaxID=158 RepID=UPI002103A622|nr:ABC transporter ATP-binding protein [Treponema denticola]